MPNIKWQINLLKSQGFRVYSCGLFRKLYYIFLRKHFKFEEWHTTPYELRPYAWDIVRYVNEMGIRNGCICDIGCGIGDIVRNIDCKHKYGFDISKEAIKCARYLEKHENRENITNFYVGSFDKVSKHVYSDIDLLLTVNFIHGMSSEQLKKQYETIFSLIKVKCIIVDIVKIPGGNDSHDFSWVLPDYYIYQVISHHKGRKCILLKRK